MRIVIFSFLMLFLIVSCNSNENIQKNMTAKSELDTTALKINTIPPVKLNKHAKKIVQEWTEYQNITEFIPNLYHTDSKQALFDSQRIAELSQQLKDSIRIEKLDIPSFRARLHVLYNESLRLADMDSIKNISQSEVVMQTSNIVNAFDAINSKINMLVSQENLEENLKEFDSILNKHDSTKKEFIPFLKPKKKHGKRVIKGIKPIKKRRSKLLFEKNKKVLERLKQAKARNHE